MLIGYSDLLSVAGGGSIGFKVSSDSAFELAVVRLFQGDDSAAGPAYLEEEVGAVCDGVYPGRVQRTEPGSYVCVDDRGAPHPTTGFSLAAWVWPTMPAHGRQAVMTRWAEDGSGYGLELLRGHAGFTMRFDDIVLELRSDMTLVSNWWHLIAAGYDEASGSLFLWQAASGQLSAPRYVLREDRAVSLPGIVPAPLIIAAATLGQSIGAHFNGRIAFPRWFERALAQDEIRRLGYGFDLGALNGAQLGLWDLGPAQPSTLVLDRSGHGHHGTAVNNPARAVRNHLWNGSAFAPSAAPEHYSCMHFHDDDLADAGWETDAVFEVPSDLPSGVYAARLRAGREEEYLPFVVRPAQGATAHVCLILPTLTYLAYGNERYFQQPDFDLSRIFDRPLQFDACDFATQAHPEFGPSIYDNHSDGSDNMYASRLRPLLNLRPKVVSYLTGAGRHLVADLYLVSWLHRKGIAFDVVTDEDVHRDGAELLARYAVVLTGSHAEYTTEQMLDALIEYTTSGGRTMYLGGNGFFWVTTLDPTAPHIMEVRYIHGESVGPGGRPPGEEHHSQTGIRGGTWRSHGRGSESWLGVGFSSQGWTEAQPYHRTEASYNPEVAWIFDGVDGHEIGAFGLALGGAAGDEMDCASTLLGTPPHAVILASSRNHGPLVTVWHDPTATDRRRADMTYVEFERGGAAFSVGSLCWCPSLPHNDYDNDVSRITHNVLARFLELSADDNDVSETDVGWTSRFS